MDRASVPPSSTTFPDIIPAAQALMRIKERSGSAVYLCVNFSTWEKPVTYASVMVHVEPVPSNADLLNVTADIAEQFHARVIGITVRQPMQMTFTDGYIPPEIVEEDRDQIRRQITKLEAEFRGALKKRVADIDWRSKILYESLPDYIVGEARSADVIVTGVDKKRLLDTANCVSASEIVMRAGRPVLIVPAGIDKLQLDRVIVGWKDTREAQRAVYDALPLLRKAKHVSVVEIANEEELGAARDRVHDVVAWLGQHSIEAHPLVFCSDDDDATKLAGVAQEQAADVIVAGAYGHSRMQEWVFGGVTRDLLFAAKCCTLVSH
jgi:nucleotide-binding universal stress UspA family protein